MAESSLDDFFAKKDKSKKKNKSKLTPSDFLAKQDAGENTSSASTKTKKKKKEKDKQNTATSNSDATNTVNTNVQKEDEEWVDFEEESEKDYTGLRIQNLQITQKEEAEVEEDDQENEIDENGESREKRDITSGPWNVSQSQPQPAAQEPPPEPPKPEAPKTTGKYIPPGARGLAAGNSLEPTRLGMRKKKGAPNLKSEDDFPTLGGGVAEVASWGPSAGSNFERVQGGGKQIEDPSKTNVQLSLGNKYAALQD